VAQTRLWRFDQLETGFWVWELRGPDDSMHRIGPFPNFEACVGDAKKNGFVDENQRLEVHLRKVMDQVRRRTRTIGTENIQSDSHAKFGTYEELEEIALDLIGRGFTEVARQDQCGPRQYYLGPEHIDFPALERYILFWKGDGE